MSDWMRRTTGLLRAAGLDLEMPSARYMARDTLLAAVQRGDLAESVIDDKVRRILRMAMRFGFFDRPQTLETAPLYSQTGRAVALDLAREGMVLLKNTNHVCHSNNRRSAPLP